jgi:CRISPR-associated protein Csb2
MLTLEIEFLTGVCFAAESQSSDQPDWPPQPDRVFSALVAAWGTRGERSDEKAALEWLEQQPAPVIEASGFEPRRVGISYVPPNDPSGKPEVMPERRRRQARMFPAAVPHRAVVLLKWALEPQAHACEALSALARDVAYMGHSASLVRCQFVLDELADGQLTETSPSRRVYPGRLAMLERDYRAGRRPLAGEFIEARLPVASREIPHSVFSDRWIVLEDADGRSPDLRASAVVTRRLREAFMSRYGAEGLSVPEFVSGHQTDGTAATTPHLAIVPMAHVGFPHSEGQLMGLGLILPRNLEEQQRNAERDWLSGLEDGEDRIQQWRTFDRMLGGIDHLNLGPLGRWEIARVLETSKKSLHTVRYGCVARRWSSVTPLVLDRFPKAKIPEERAEEIESIVSAACVNIGLPEPHSIRVSKHSAVKGAPSAYPSGNAPVWTKWTLPGFRAKRMLIHVSIEFEEPVCGPVILGAGRFAGLGLCVGNPA